ncbi:hypothetical protein AB4Y43_17130 [Paraburkholderia sp. BR10872]|uniref:hypothetical protein n=1 Tax=Paraburkholderia sp. BR10872 TaxID=3236989 RepID=UPI0034D265D8
MKYTASEIKNISSATDNARATVTDFCTEAIDEARERLKLVNSIANLTSILDARQLAIAADARAGIRHIHAAILDVHAYHDKPTASMSGRFDEALKEIGEMKEKVEKLYRWLDSLYSHD